MLCLHVDVNKMTTYQILDIIWQLCIHSGHNIVHAYFGRMLIWSRLHPISISFSASYIWGYIIKHNDIDFMNKTHFQYWNWRHFPILTISGWCDSHLYVHAHLLNIHTQIAYLSQISMTYSHMHNWMSYTFWLIYYAFLHHCFVHLFIPHTIITVVLSTF